MNNRLIKIKAIAKLCGIILAIIFAAALLHAAETTVITDETEFEDSRQEPEVSEEESEVDAQLSEVMGKIRGIDRRWSVLDPLHRPSAVIAVNTIKIVQLPKLVEYQVRRGFVLGDIISVEVSGSLMQLVAFANGLQSARSKMMIESIEVRFGMFEGGFGEFRIFTPTSILLDRLPKNASLTQKKSMLGTAKRVFEEIRSLDSDTLSSFNFIADIFLRWPIGFTPIEKVVFEDDTYSIYPTTPLRRFDPLVADMAAEFGKLAAPSKVNFAPIFGPLIDGRDVDFSVADDRLNISWRGIPMFNVKADKIISRLADKSHIFVVMETELPCIREADASRGIECKLRRQVVRAFNLHGGAIAWENVYYGNSSFSNLLFDTEHRLIYGCNLLLTAVDPNNGKIIKRWPLSGRASEVILDKEGDLIVREDSFNATPVTEYIIKGEREGPPFLRAAELAAGQLFSETLNNFIDPTTRPLDSDETLKELAVKHVGEMTPRLKEFASRDPSNPWGIFFKGLTVLLAESEGATAEFEAAVSMPVENPYHYLHLGKQLEILGFIVQADSCYEEAFKKFLLWYRPGEIYSRFTGHKIFLETAGLSVEAGNIERASILLDWLRTFQPVGERMDALALEEAAWWHQKGDSKRETLAMGRYRDASREGFGLTIRWRIREFLFRIFCYVVFIVLVLLWLIMAAKYNRSRKARLAQLGHDNFRSRLLFLLDTPANWFKFNTLSFLTRRDRRALLVLWAVLFIMTMILLINGRMLDMHLDSTLQGDFDSPAFVDELKERLGVEKNPEAKFMLGVSCQQRGESKGAERHYTELIREKAQGAVAAKTLNNLGVIAFENEDVEAARKLFEEATSEDPWLAEPLFNRGVVGKNGSYKERAVELGLESEYLAYYPEKPVRCGIDKNIFAKAFRGHSFDISKEFIHQWAQLLTGNTAWQSGGKLNVLLHYILILLGLMLLVYYFAPSHETEPEDSARVKWQHLLPGVGGVLRGAPMIGAVIAILFLFSIAILLFGYHFGPSSIIPESDKLFPMVYSNLDSTYILRREPLLRNVMIFAWIALPASIAANTLYAFLSEKTRS